jgi:hypothetical protein
VVFEEYYSQVAESRTGARHQRTLRSDLTIIAGPGGEWVEFRDVFEVDGRAVRDRFDRVVALFAEPNPDALVLARKIVAEGARYNLGPGDVAFERTLNVPTGALLFLLSGNQGRVRFARAGEELLSGRPAIVVRFEEVDHPRLIGSPDGAPSRGTFWLQAGSGRVLQSELRMSTRRGNVIVGASLRVTYNAVDGEKVWFPGSMEEDYTLMDLRERRIASVSGRATYSNIRRFSVGTTDDRVASPTR